MTYKGYRIEPLGTFAMFRIRQGAQGGVPAALSGLFSKVEYAQAQIDGYLNSLKKGGRGKAKADGEKESVPTG